MHFGTVLSIHRESDPIYRSILKYVASKRFDAVRRFVKNCWLRRYAFCWWSFGKIYDAWIFEDIAGFFEEVAEKDEE
jgi:hypothetical protein